MWLNESVNAVPPRRAIPCKLVCNGSKAREAGPNCVWRNVLCRLHSMCR